MTGYCVELPEWRSPVVCDVESGRVHLDNFNGRWSRGDDNQEKRPTTPVGTDLLEVTVNVTVHHSQQATHETQAFDAKWQFCEDLVGNVPMTATIQGYDIKVTDYVFNESCAHLGTVPIASSFRTTSE